MSKTTVGEVAMPTPEQIREALPLMTPLERIEWSALVKAMNASRLKTVGEDIVLEALFDKQRDVVLDPHRFITVCAGRRGGKTYAVAGMMLRAARMHARRTVLYLHLTRDGAKGIIWPTLKLLNDLFGFGGVCNETDLTMTMPNGAVIALRGVDKRKEIEKRRGYGFALVVLDECQSIPDYVRTLVNDVIGPALADVPGKLVMIGTPSLVPNGYWHECHHNPNPVWGHHAWDMWDNPHIPNPDQAFADECQRRGVLPDDVSMQREWKGRWIRDASSAVFTFDPLRNLYAELPPALADLWRYVISVDIGGGVERDNDAISVLAFHPHLRGTWLTEEHIDGTQDVTSLALEVKGIRTRLGPRNVVAVVADTGGLGSKVAVEMQQRHAIPVVAAKKAGKWANIALLNAACSHGEFFAPTGSRFAAEVVKVEKDWDKSTPDKIAIKGHMPDVCDSVLYGYVESLAWNAKTAPLTDAEKRAELAAIIKKASTPPTREELDKQAKADIDRYAKELAKEQRARERQERWGW